MTESERQVQYLEAFEGPGIFGLYWGDPQADQPLVSILEEWLLPQIGPNTVAVEIGSGGGRWTRFMHAAMLLYSIDATPKSEELVRREFKRLNDELLEDSMGRMVNRLESGDSSDLAAIVHAAADELQQRQDWRECKNVRFIVADSSGQLPAIPTASVNYVFSFDTFVHFEPSTFDGYVREIARALKPGGVAHLHYAAKVGETIGKEFRYREPGEVERLLREMGLEQNRTMPLAKGYGSMLVEAVKA